MCQLLKICYLLSAGDDGLGNVTMTGVLKSGLPGNGICEIGELQNMSEGGECPANCAFGASM